MLSDEDFKKIKSEIIQNMTKTNKKSLSVSLFLKILYFKMNNINFLKVIE